MLRRRRTPQQQNMNEITPTNQFSHGVYNSWMTAHPTFAIRERVSSRIMFLLALAGGGWMVVRRPRCHHIPQTTGGVCVQVGLAWPTEMNRCVNWSPYLCTQGISSLVAQSCA